MKRSIWITGGYLFILLIATVVNALVFPGSAMSGLSDYLDREGLDPAMAQWTLEESMEKYKYNGKPITEIVVKMFHDGAYGGGKQCTAEHFGYSNDFRAETREDRRWANYSNSFYTDIVLEGMELPCGVCFGDTVAEVLQKLYIFMNPDKEFVSDQGNETVMTLFSEEGAALKLTDFRNRSGKYSYQLEYAEIYTSDHRVGRDTLVTRSVILLFDKESGQLSRLGLRVLEEYPMGD